MVPVRLCLMVQKCYWCQSSLVFREICLSALRSDRGKEYSPSEKVSSSTSSSASSCPSFLELERFCVCWLVVCDDWRLICRVLEAGATVWVLAWVMLGEGVGTIRLYSAGMLTPDHLQKGVLIRNVPQTGFSMWEKLLIGSALGWASGAANRTWLLFLAQSLEGGVRSGAKEIAL